MEKFPGCGGFVNMAVFRIVFAVVTSTALAAAMFLPASAAAEVVRIKDLGKLQGWRENALIGTGIVTGLAGTGDSSSNRTARQALSNAMSQFNLNVSPDQIQSRNVAVVMVNASLSPFSREGDTLDVTVTSVGDARSLVGGSLMLTPMKAANGRVYALAQGPLSVGGYRYDANGNVVQKNHPTVGSVPNGATVELGVSAQMATSRSQLTFVLSEPDYTTASRIADAINQKMGQGRAYARDASGIELTIPESQQQQLVAFVAQLESVTVEPDRRAKVILNERTGTVVSGGDVRISKVAISHGDIKLSIRNETTASQPSFIGQAGDGVRTALVTNTQVSVDEQSGAGFVAGSTTVSDLVQSLNRLKTPTRDIISILRAVKAAGALHAELIIQ
ncbi:flagellar basal body P-ring protein FlgI [Acidovorax sp. 1608163]|uniref:flagellar basal body P-ring protein FlgI n=1 Tax=Acidovorax sp. 1608163 TaxID=2478662 RepID=UPI001F093C0F|nr:flagellar basal body P-ring protein FlgI [Acidovorax sp. 1608163]